MNKHDASDSRDGARRRSSRPWDSTSTRPSAYAHYKKLVHDYDSLEEDLERSRLVQQELEAQLQRHHREVEAREEKQGEQELAAWGREREQRVEDICVHSATVEALQKQRVALEEEEIRLQAELEVLHERQQQENETEAKKIFDLVHGRTSLLEKELAKRQMDMEFLTHIVSTAKRRKEANESQGESVHSLVGAIQKRRQDAFKEATAQFQERLQSFEREKEALKQKAEEIKWKKQRALQILSTNQQQVISGFFTTPRAAIQDANPPMPSLEYSTILDAMKQTSGDVVSRLQDAEHGKATARRQMEDALAEAERNLKFGPQKLEALQKSMENRQQEALQLTMTSAPQCEQPSTAKWSVETYREDQYSLVYFIRSMIFAWMERALDISRSQPETHLLEQELRRYEETRAVLDSEEGRERRVLWASQIARGLEYEVLREMAQSIHDEFTFSATQIHDVIVTEMKDALFAPAQESPATTKNTPKSVKLGASTAPSLRLAMFEASWDEVRRLRTETSTRLPRLLMRLAEYQAVNSQPTAKTSRGAVRQASATSVSPTKKRFGLFTGNQKSPVVAESISAPTTVTPQPASSPVGQPDAFVEPERAAVLSLATEVATTDTGLNIRDARATEELIWQRQVNVSSTSFYSLSTCGVVSCLQLSVDGRLLAIGTVDGEVIVFSIGEDETSLAVAIREFSAPKTSSVRILRFCFSACGRFLMSYDQLKVASLWSLSVPLPATHLSESFPSDHHKFKPTPLHLVSQLSPSELLQVPTIQRDVAERDAPGAAARLQAMPPVAFSALTLFPSLALTGQPTHILCGTTAGDILKVSLTHVTNDGRQPNPGNARMIGSVNEATVEAPRVQDLDLVRIDNSKGNFKREFFRHGHHSSVLFVGSINSLGSRDHQTRIVSVDQSGTIALWTYDRESFSGFGWFTPESTCRLDLLFTITSVSPGASIRGEILQIQLTPDRKTLVLMVFATASLQQPAKNTAPAPLPGRLRFVQVDLTSSSLSVRRVRLELDLVGSIPPRFALLSMRLPAQALSRPESARSKRKATSSVLALLMNNALDIYSLATGEQCRPPISLSPSPTQDGKAKAGNRPTLLFNSITASSGTRQCVVCVGGEQHREIQIFRFRTNLTLLSHYALLAAAAVPGVRP